MADSETYRHSIGSILYKISEKIVRRYSLKTEIIEYYDKNEYDLVIIDKEDFINKNPEYKKLPDILIKLSIKEKEIHIRQNWTDIKIEKELIKENKKIKKRNIILEPQEKLNKNPLDKNPLNNNPLIIRKSLFIYKIRDFFSPIKNYIFDDLPRFFIILTSIVIVFSLSFLSYYIPLSKKEKNEYPKIIKIERQEKRFIGICPKNKKEDECKKTDMIEDFRIRSTNGVYLGKRPASINIISGNYQESERICAIEKNTKIKILNYRRIPNNQLWYEIEIIERGEEYKEKKIISENTTNKNKTIIENKTENKTIIQNKNEENETKPKPEDKTENPGTITKTEITNDMSIMSKEENCPLNITTGWIIGKYGGGRKTININVDPRDFNVVKGKDTFKSLDVIKLEEHNKTTLWKQIKAFLYKDITTEPEELWILSLLWEKIQSFLFYIKFYKLFPMSLGIMIGFRLYCYAKSGDNSSLFWNYIRTRGVLLFCISLSAVIFVDSYVNRLDWYSRHYQNEFSWGLLGKLVQDLLGIFFVIDNFLGNVTAGFILTLLFLRFFPMDKEL